METINGRTPPESLPTVENIKSENTSENSTDNTPGTSSNNSPDNSPSNSPENSPENSPNKIPENDSKRRKSSFEDDENIASPKISKFNFHISLQQKTHNSSPNSNPNLTQSSTHNSLNPPQNSTLNSLQNSTHTRQNTPQNTTTEPSIPSIDISTDTNFQELIGFMHTKYQEQIVSTIQGSSKFSDIIQHWQTAYTSFSTKHHDLTRENLKLEQENLDLKMNMQKIIEVQDLFMQKQQFDDQISSNQMKLSRIAENSQHFGLDGLNFDANKSFLENSLNGTLNTSFNTALNTTLNTTFSSSNDEPSLNTPISASKIDNLTSFLGEILESNNFNSDEDGKANNDSCIFPPFKLKSEFSDTVDNKSKRISKKRECPICGKRVVKLPRHLRTHKDHDVEIYLNSNSNRLAFGSRMQGNSLVNGGIDMNGGLSQNGVDLNGQQVLSDQNGNISYENSIMASIKEVMTRNVQNSVYEQASSQIVSQTLLLQNGHQLNESTSGIHSPNSNDLETTSKIEHSSKIPENNAISSEFSKVLETLSKHAD